MDINYEFIINTEQISQSDIVQLLNLFYQLSSSKVEINELKIKMIIEKSDLLVARDKTSENKIIGTCCLASYSTILGTKGRIEDVVVDVAYRNKGIGRQMTLMLIEKARERGFSEVWLTSRASRVAANDLYKKLGFSNYETNIYRLKVS
jgi:ribosomal protein S18 acetylase RimI-like enzyme